MHCPYIIYYYSIDTCRYTFVYINLKKLYADDNPCPNSIPKYGYLMAISILCRSTGFPMIKMQGFNYYIGKFITYMVDLHLLQSLFFCAQKKSMFSDV